MGAHSKVRRFRRVRSVATVALMAAAGLVWAANPSQALPACPIPGNFEIDGDMTQVTCTPGADDWNTPNIGVQSTSQGGTYKTAGKDDSNPSGWQSTGSTPDKTNFEQAYATSRLVGGHFYVFVAWERTDTSGTQGYAIEIDNSSANVGADGTPQPDRSSGGAVFYISSVGSSAPQFDGACSFSSQSSYGQMCTNSNASITAAINTSSISDPLRGTTQAAGSFFEAALDVTALTGIMPSCPGASANSVYLRSITGQTHNGNLKGYMAPLSVAPDSTCVAPSIATTATPGGALNPVGSTQHDTVTVGTAQKPGVGSVKFFLCQPAQVSTNGGDCSSGGAQVGTAKTLDANGQAVSDNVSGATTPNDNATGKYCWRAEFTPSANDHNYLPGKHTNTDTECFTVVHGTPTIATQISVTGANAPGLGFTTLGDAAQLSGFVGSVAGETISFNLYGPFGNGTTPTCDPAHLVTSAATTGTLNASGQATTAQNYKPTAAGTYVWVASYPGDALNDSVKGKCSDANESATIVAAQIDVSKSANPPGPVSAGDSVGFDITVTNAGSVPATGVHVTDNLPAGADGVGGGDLNWALDPSYQGCTITGAVGSQVLDCSFNQVDGPGSLPVIHLSSPTSPADCGTVKNKASVSTTNGTGHDSDVATVSVLCPSLTLSKKADNAKVDAGQQIGFTITASNGGPGIARNVVIDDPLPAGAGVNWSIASSPNNCSITGAVGNQTLHCTAVDLGSGASESAHVVSGTAFASCKAYHNTASLTTSNGSPLQASDTTTVQCPALTLTKTPDASVVDAGAPIGFTITAQNSSAAGTGTAHSVVIDDPLPAGAGVNWSIASGPNNCSITGAVGSQTLHCTAVDLAPGASESVHVTSKTSFESCATLPNEASLTAGNHPSLTADASTRVACAKVTLTKDADAATVNAGEPIGFTITAKNSAVAGTGTAHNVVISDPLPTGTGVSWSVSPAVQGCSISNATLTCTVGDLAPGDSFTVHVASSTQNASCTVYPNTATLSASNHPDVDASATTTVQCPSLAVDKTADDPAVSAGSPIGFTVVVSNGGPGTATAATLNDPLPAGTGINWSISPAYSGPGSCSISGAVGSQLLHCSFGNIGAGGSASVHITSATAQASCAAYSNTATVSASNAPDAVDSARTTVQCPDVSVVKTADADHVDAGEQIGFTVTVRNSDAAGTGTATAAVLDDPLPGGPGIDWSIESGPNNCSIQGSPQSQTLHCTAVDLAPGGSETVHVVSATTFDSCAGLVNVASATGSNFDLITDTAATSVQCPSLTLTKTADAATVDAGDQIGFTVTAANGGPGAAKDVVVDDPLPGGDGVDWSIDSAPNNCSIQGSPQSQTLHCTGVTLGAGDSEVIHVVSGTAFASCQTYDNTASVTAGNSPSPDPASASTTVQCPSLTLTKTAYAATVDAGDQIGFTVTVSNGGPGAAKDVVVDDPLPAGNGIAWSIDPAYDEPQNCSITGTVGQTLHCTGVTLGAGDSEVIHVVSGTAFASCQTYDNTASVTAANSPSPDPASASTTVQCPSLSLVKTADDATVSSGDAIGFTLTAKNAGPGTANAATLTDALPAGAGVDWSIDPAYDGPGTCAITGDVGSQMLNCEFGDLASGVVVAVHVSSQTTLESCTTYPNTATLSARNHPDVTDDADTTVQCPNVSIVKTADADTVTAGGQIGFTVTASNGDAAGTGTAKGVVIDDPLPAGPGVDWSIDSGPDNCSVTGTAPNQTLECSAVDLAPGESESVHVVSDTAFASCAAYDNTATLTLTNGAAPGPASASTTVQCPALAITKTADAASVAAGKQIGFVITVSNAGPGTAVGATLNDPLPAGRGVSWSIDDAGTTAADCAITGAAGAQVLGCKLGDLGVGTKVTVHLVSSTTDESCATYPNVATLDAANAPELTADASTRVTTCLGILPTSAVNPPPPPAAQPPGPTAETGAGRLDLQLELVALLVGGGIVLTLLGRRRRGRHVE